MDNVVERLIVAVGFRVDKGSMRTAMQGYATIAAGMAAATAAAVGFTISQAAADDELTKTAHSLGMTTEAYTALTYAMDREGVASQQLGGSLRYLQTQLEGAARGSGEALPWLQRFGIEATDSAGRVRLAADVLPELGDALAGLSDGDRLSASLRVLGESGARMGVALAKGGDNLRDLVADARALGAVLDEEAGAQAEVLTDSMTRLQAAGTGLGRIVSKRLTPAVTVLVDQLTDWLTESDSIVRVGLERTADAMAWALEGMSTPLGKVVTGLGALSVAVVGLKAVASVPMLGGLVTALGAVSAPAWVTVAAVGATVLVLDDLYVAAQGGDSAIMHMAESMGYATEASDLLEGSIEKTSDAMGTLAAAGRAWTAVANYMWPDGYLTTFTTFLGQVRDGYGYLLSWVLPLEQIEHGLSAIVGALTDFDSMTAGLDRFANYMSSDAAFNLDTIGDLITEGATGTLQWAGGVSAEGFGALGEGLRTGVSQLPVSSTFAPTNNIAPNVSVSVNDIGEAARAAGREVEHQVRASYQTSQVPL